jgi:hypothetical protein
MAIAFAIVLGISSTIGTLVPLLVFVPDKLMKHQGVSIMAGIAIALVGPVVVSWAAWERDSRNKGASDGAKSGSEGSRRNTVIGLGLCIASMIIVANVSGARTGEWKGSSLRTLWIMAAGIPTLMIVIMVVGMAGGPAWKVPFHESSWHVNVREEHLP